MAKDGAPDKDEQSAPAAHDEPEGKTAERKLAQKRYGALAVAGIAVVLAFTAGMVIEHASARRDMIRPMGVGGFIMGQRGQAGPPGLHARRLNSSDDNATRISGVVTAVNGSTFTVAGHGATNSVQTTSSTQFTGGDKVAINDSVLVSGTTNNGTYTATKVAINP